MAFFNWLNHVSSYDKLLECKSGARNNDEVRSKGMYQS